MKAADIIPFDPYHPDIQGVLTCGHGYEWLNWPGLDEHQNGYEFTGLGRREKIFGVSRDLQLHVSWKVFHNMRTGFAGSIPIADAQGQNIFFMPRQLHEEITIRIENDISQS